MEGTASSDQPKPADPHSCSPCSPTNNKADVATDSSSHSVNDSGPSTPTIENLPETMSGTAGVKVLRPYEIEEPDDDPAPPVQRRLGLPCLPDYFEIWQRELADRIDDLDNQVETSPRTKLSSIPKGGRKRKPIGAAGAGDYSPTGSHRSKSKAKLDDPALPGCDLNPKRRRRRSKLTEEMDKGPHTVSLHDFREAGANESSSSDLQSSSSVDTTDDTALADEMDID